MKRSTFFAEIKELFGSYDQSQVENIDAIIDEFEKRKWIDLRFLAYIFATIYHETGVNKNGKLYRSMASVEETGKGYRRRYGSKVWYDNKPYTDIETIFYGRGHTQNTWRDNYQALTIESKGKYDFVHNPELLLEMEPSIWATFTAMSKGIYTGKRLNQYFTDHKEDPVGARWIINRQDKAEMIAKYYRVFRSALYKAIA